MWRDFVIQMSVQFEACELVVLFKVDISLMSISFQHLYLHFFSDALIHVKVVNTKELQNIVMQSDVENIQLVGVSTF